ncbi:Flagellar hook-associated protein 2 [compost metagenome]
MATLRVSGLASGIDVDSIVKQTMIAKKVPLDKLNQQKQILEWQRDNYREINSKLVDFKTNKLVKYDLSSAMITQTAVVSGDTAAIKAEATGDANGIAMDIEVKQIAKAASQVTTGATMLKADKSRLNSSSTLADLQKLNSNTAANAEGKYTLTINGTAIELDEKQTIAEAVATINKTTAAKVTAAFDETTGKLSITSKTFSSSGEVGLGTSDTFTKLFGTGTPVATGYQPAIINVNGVEDMEFASNSVVLNGIKLTLQDKTTSATKITTTTDPTKALETIKSFVSDYNELLSTLNTRINEERYTDYTPLTDDQREEMTESQIEAWEAKAKSGMLKNDEILKSTISTMRSLIASELGKLGALGITTGEYYENGKIYIDEEKLKSAITANPQEVSAIFQGATGSANTGLFDKLSLAATNTIEKLSTKAGTSRYSSDVTATFKTDSTMGKALINYNKRISAMEDRLDDYENNLYKKYTAMETAISKYNSQSASLTSYLS